MYKTLLTLITLLLLGGCAAKKSYILYSENTPAVTLTFHQSIGIKSIELPAYLLHKEIPYKTAHNEIIYLKNKQWISYLDEQLTNRLVNTFQKALNTPNIYLYPQNSPEKTDIILQITIHQFIADHKSVLLEASWQQSSAQETKSKRFKTEIPITSQEDVIEGMNSAFGKLESALLESL